MRLYYRLYQYWPTSPLAGEALWRAADIRWQLEKSGVILRPSSRELSPDMRTQIDDEIDRIAAARAKKHGRFRRGNARPVGSDQQVGPEEIVAMLHADLAQAHRAHFLAHLDQELGVEAESTALSQYRSERGAGSAACALLREVH